VRDAILGRHSEYLDLDFVLPDKVVDTARTIARHYKAGFVLLDEERQIARVVFPQGTVDFAQQVGPTLEADLLRRDFTVNAIAYNPQNDLLVDPLRGRLDLKQQQIRMVSVANLEEDPLRLLRAYRQAAQLGFSLEPETQVAIRELAPLLGRIAAERIQSELNYLLSTEAGTPWLTQAWQDNLLKSWLPDATARSLELVEKVDHVALLLNETSPTFARGLFSHLRPSSSNRHEGKNGGLLTAAESKASGSARNWLITAKLACLQSPSAEVAEMQLRKLKYSRSEIQSVSTVLKFLPALCQAAGLFDRHSTASLSSPPAVALSLKEQYFFFQGVGAVFPAVAVMAIAHGVTLDAIAPLIERFLNPSDPVAHPTALLTGQDLMKHLKISAGPLVGQLLAAIQLARAEGKITSREDALQLAREITDRMC
jgi:tRNA nucleotidyltransferase (CCA-adding enzyme)